MGEIVARRTRDISFDMDRKREKQWGSFFLISLQQKHGRSLTPLSYELFERSGQWQEYERTTLRGTNLLKKNLFLIKTHDALYF